MCVCLGGGEGGALQRRSNRQMQCCYGCCARVTMGRAGGECEWVCSEGEGG